MKRYKKFLQLFLLASLFTLVITTPVSYIGAMSGNQFDPDYEVIAIRITDVQINDLTQVLDDEFDDEAELKWVALVQQSNGLFTEIEYPSSSFITTGIGEYSNDGQRGLVNEIPLRWYLEDGDEEFVVFLMGIDIDDSTLDDDFTEFVIEDEEGIGIPEIANAVAEHGIGNILEEIVNKSGTLVSSALSSDNIRKVAVSMIDKSEMLWPAAARKAGNIVSGGAAILGSVASPLVGFVVGVGVEMGTDAAINYFAAHDEIGTAAIILRKDEAWNVGDGQIRESSNGAITFVYDVRGYSTTEDVFDSPDASESEDIVTNPDMLITNNTKQPVCEVYLTPLESSTGSSPDQDLTFLQGNQINGSAFLPGERRTIISYPIGSYTATSYDCYGREISARSIFHRIGANSVWSISAATGIDYDNDIEIYNFSGKDICYLRYGFSDENEWSIEDALGFYYIADNASYMLSLDFASSNDYLDIEVLDCRGTIMDALSSIRKGFISNYEFSTWVVRDNSGQLGEENLRINLVNDDNDERETICGLFIRPENRDPEGVDILSRRENGWVFADGQHLILSGFDSNDTYEVDIDECNGEYITVKFDFFGKTSLIWPGPSN